MNKANQEALLHATNIGLIDIRQSEINYYTHLYSSFGTQAALIGGFTYSVFTQNEDVMIYQKPIDTVILDIYWILSSATVLASVHLVINCMMLQVLGPGLALNGPVGSMIRATSGMRKELNQIVVSYIIMIVLFALSTTLSYWVIMDFTSAIATTIFSIIAMYYWYYYCERIYLRFHWNEEESGWKETTDDLDEDIDNNYQLDTDADGNAFRRNNTQQSNDDKDQTNKEQQSLKEVNDVTQKFFKSMKASMSSKKTSSLNELLLDGCENSPSDSLGGSTSNRDYIGAVEDRDTAISFGQSLYKNVAMEGFLTKRSMSQKYSSKQWERVYVSITKNARLHYYKSRSEFRTNPKSHLNLRAIVLSEFKVVIVNSMLEANIDDQDDISVLTGDLNSSISDRNGKKFSDAENSSVVSDSRSGVSMRKTGTDTNRDVDEIIYRQRKRGSLFGSVVHDQSEDSKLSKKNLPIFEIKMIPRDEAEEFGFRLSETSRDSFTVKKSGSGNKKGRWLVWRCDTEEELNSWVLAIKSVCNECFL